MTFEEIIRQATVDINEAISCFGIDNALSFEVGEPLTDEQDLQDGFATIGGVIKFTYGNIEHKHNVLIGWTDVDGVGFGHGEDGAINKITYGNMMREIYFNLALVGLEGKYLL